jgi:hypothetical protein
VRECYKVGITYENIDGYIEYNLGNKCMNVVLDNEEKRQAVERYLQGERVMKVSAGENVSDFIESTVKSLESVDNLRQALTRMWQETGVAVQWSRPV